MMADEHPNTATIPSTRIRLTHKVADLDEQFQKAPVSWAVYQTQWLLGSGGAPLYAFNFTRIDSDMWCRVTGELSHYDEWQEGEPEDKDEYPVVLRVSVEADHVEDGFVSIAFWLKDLEAWAKALHEAGENGSRPPTGGVG